MKIKNLIFIIALMYVAGAILVNALPTDISSEDLLRLRNIEYEQAKRIIRMQELKAEFDKLDIERQQSAIARNDWIKEQAKKQNIDLTKYQWDSDKLKFVEIVKQEKPNE